MSVDHIALTDSLHVVSRPFSAPLRDGHHWFVVSNGEDYAGPCNTSDDAERELTRIAVELRPEDTDCERAATIACARQLDAEWFEESTDTGPGKFEHNSDRPLAVALNILSMHGCENERAGDSDSGYGSRFGTYVLWGDSNGFLTAERFETEGLASAAVASLDAPRCPDCGRAITLQLSGWWTHDGLADGCWQKSMDGPDEN